MPGPGLAVPLVLGGLGGALSFIGGLAESSTNRSIAQKNLRLQKKQFRYQKDLQQEMFQREDTAVQRRTADLRAAGLSPVLAAGSGAQAGPVVKTEAPQDPYRADYSKMTNAIMQMAAISQTTAQTKLLNAQAKKTNEEAKYTGALAKENVMSLQYKNQVMRETINDVIDISHSNAIIKKYNALQEACRMEGFKLESLKNRIETELVHNAVSDEYKDSPYLQWLREGNMQRKLDNASKQVLIKYLEARNVGIEMDADFYQWIGLSPASIKAMKDGLDVVSKLGGMFFGGTK